MRIYENIFLFFFLNYPMAKSRYFYPGELVAIKFAFKSSLSLLRRLNETPV